MNTIKSKAYSAMLAIFMAITMWIGIFFLESSWIKQDGETLVAGIGSLLRDHRNLVDPYSLAQNLSDLEHLNLIRCPHLRNLAEDGSPKLSYLDHRFKPGCSADLSKLRNQNQSVVFSAINGEKWAIGFIPVVKPYIIIAGWISRIAVSLLSLFVGLIVFLKLNREEESKQLVRIQFETVQRTAQMVAHDVRKPFSTLKMMLKTLSEVEEGQVVRELIGVMGPQLTQDVTQANELLDDLLEVGRETKLSLSPISLTELFHEIKGNVDRRIPKNLIFELRNELIPDLVYMDVPKMRRVFENIVSNSVEAAPPGERLWVSINSSLNPESVKIKIGNSGSYMAPDVLNQLFTPFFTFGKEHGTGLGLTIAKKYVDLHDGTIHCRSDQTLGVEFEITLPFHKLPHMVQG